MPNLIFVLLSLCSPFGLLLGVLGVFLDGLGYLLHHNLFDLFLELLCLRTPPLNAMPGADARLPNPRAANYDANVATFRQTSLTAFQEVEDNLAALRILENEAQQQEQAVTSSKDSLQLLTNRYRGGVDTYLQVITAETTELSNERNAIDILRRRMEASVLLVKALGGGWDSSDLPTFGARRVKDY